MLLSRIGPSRRPGPPPPQVEDGGSAPRALGVPDALRALGLADVGRDMYGVAVQVTLDLDGSGQMTEQSVRTLLRATTEGAQRWFHAVFAEEPVSEPLVLDRAVGVEVGSSFTRSEVGLFLVGARAPPAAGRRRDRPHRDPHPAGQPRQPGHVLTSTTSTGGPPTR